MKYILKSNFIFVLLFSFCLNAQNDILNFNKYWYYKTRFNNDFIKIGLLQGESVPFNERGDERTTGYPSLFDSNTQLRTGDAIASIGMHIAFLATEYALLKNNNQKTDSVKHELFCALNALNRIDNFSEQWFPNGNTMPLNGFMIRDDMDNLFLYRNYDHFNYYSHGIHPDTFQPEGFYPNDQDHDRGFCSQMLIGQNKMASSFKNIQNGGSAFDNTMSQDHIITLLMGLNLINKYVDYSATDNNTVFPYEGANVRSLKQEAWNITDRIAQHFKNDPLWNLRNPINDTLVEPGGNTTFVQYGMAESMCRAENFTTNLPNPFVPLINPFGSLVPFTCNYNALYVNTIGLPAWMGFIASPSTNMDWATFKVDLLATGNCGWQTGIVNVAQYVCNSVASLICPNLPWPFSLICSWVTSLVCGTIQIPVTGFNNLTEIALNIHVLDPYGNEQNKEAQLRRYDLIHAPLLHKILFPNDNTTYSAYLPSVKSALDDAPCVGPYNFGPFARPQFEWTTNNRIEHTENRQDFNEPVLGWNSSLDPPNIPKELQIHTKRVQFGEFNGIDYMMLHNLYRLTASGLSASAYYQDLSHRYINVPLPVIPLCAQPNHCVIRAFETITADNVVNSNADIDFKAGKYIDLKPGFYVAPGANLYAYIQPANCISGAAGLRTVIDSTKGPENNFTGYDVMGDDIVTHYVNYDNVKDSIRENLMAAFIPTKNIEQINEINKEEAVKDAAKLLGKENYFNVYPNPASDLVTIDFTLNENENAQLTILNNIGEIIAIDEVSNTRVYRKIIYMSSLGKGIYLVRIVTSNNRVEMKKLTIQ